MKIASYIVAVSLCAAALPASAAYVIDIQQVGSDVVATGSGTIDFTGLTFVGFDLPSTPTVDASTGFLDIGVPSAGDEYDVVSGPSSFGSGGSIDASSGAGLNDYNVGVNGSDEIILPAGYPPGGPIPTNTATWSGATLASLGLQPEPTSGPGAWTP